MDSIKLGSRAPSVVPPSISQPEAPATSATHSPAAATAPALDVFHSDATPAAPELASAAQEAAPNTARNLGFDIIDNAGGPSTTDPATGLTIAPGVERWPVKTGTDPDASKVNLTPTPSTVADLNTIPAPSKTTQSARIAPTELQTYQLNNVHIIGIKGEPDGDFHLIVSDDSAGTHTMDVEVPYPPFASGSAFLQQITAARAAVNANFKVTGSMQKVDIPATITGVAFFDRLHGQTGGAANGIELHPMLSIDFHPSPTPTPTPPPTPSPTPVPTPTPTPTTGQISAQATPNQSFPAGGSVTSTLHLDGAFDLSKLTLTMDAAHRDSTGLQVVVTSPSGKQVTVPVSPGEIARGSFDLSSQFAGEPVQGDWKITVSSRNAKDTGRFANWRLDAEGCATPDPDPDSHA